MPAAIAEGVGKKYIAADFQVLRAKMLCRSRQRSAAEELANRLVDEPGIFRVLRRVAGAVPSDRRDRPQIRGRGWTGDTTDVEPKPTLSWKGTAPDRLR
jgi:hypothetical protein